MSQLAGTAYDPTTAVTASTAALLAMIALDQTNLRLTFTAPANGRVLVRLSGVVHGAATYPQILLGVMSGATVFKRKVPNGEVCGVASATTFMTVETLFTVGGLTAGASLTWDAAFGVEVAVAGTGIKYGGPNDALAGTAFGAFSFEIYDTA